jgi:hypothetical protein
MRASAPLVLVLVLLALCACGSPAGDGSAGPSESPAWSIPAPTVSTPAAPAPVATVPTAPVPLPDVPRQNAGLDAQPQTRRSSPPANLRVADVQLDMRVLPMGVDTAGAMELPADTAEAGWYRFGPAPGVAGTTVLAAHVDSLVTGLGAFARLRDVPVGAAVTVTTADGAAHGYRVTDVERTPKTEVPLDLLFERSGAERLVLVTCGGEFDRSTGHYRDNVIVTAIPDP